MFYNVNQRPYFLVKIEQGTPISTACLYPMLIVICDLMPTNSFNPCLIPSIPAPIQTDRHCPLSRSYLACSWHLNCMKYHTPSPTRCLSLWSINSNQNGIYSHWSELIDFWSDGIETSCQAQCVVYLSHQEGLHWSISLQLKCCLRDMSHAPYKLILPSCCL